MSLKKQYLKSKPVCKVTFSMNKEAVSGAGKVDLLGEFNNWNTAEPVKMKMLKNGSLWFFKSLKTRFEDKVFGPEFPLIPRIQNRYINVIQIKIPLDKNLAKSKKIILKIRSSFESISKFRSIQISIDVDPYN